MNSFQLAMAATLIGIAGLSQPANAQPSDQPGSRASNQMESSANNANEDCGPRGMHRGMMGPSRDIMGWHRGMMGPRGWGGGPRIAGAHFHFSRGDASIDIRCPADQAVERCVRAAGDLIDKVMSMKQSGVANPTPGQKPPSPQ
jgi:hypothetical protein